MARDLYQPQRAVAAASHRTGSAVSQQLRTAERDLGVALVEPVGRGIRLTDAGLQLLIATSGYDVDTEARQAMNLVTRGADALALCGVGQSPQLLKFLRQRALPTVHVMTYPAPADTVCVGFDNAKAIGQAVRYLLDLGHRRVAMLALAWVVLLASGGLSHRFLSFRELRGRESSSLENIKTPEARASSLSTEARRYSP